jgi:hypothetical protein
MKKAEMGFGDIALNISKRMAIGGEARQAALK